MVSAARGAREGTPYEPRPVRAGAHSRRRPLWERWEQRVQRAAHPIAYPVLDAVPWPVRRVPGLGVLVTDAELSRSVLLDTERFSKRGPGASSDLWTPVLGPSVLLNMHGEDHARLRRRLAPIFSPAVVTALVDAALAEDVAALAERLRAGQRVDLARFAREAASGIIAGLVGMPAGAYDGDLFGRVTALTGMVSLARPRFTARQIAKATPILDELMGLARAAYRAGDDRTVPGRLRGLGLDEREALGAVAAFAITGTETLVSAVPRIAAILIDTGWLSRLRAEDRVRDAIEEGLRVTVPTPVMLRSTTQDAAIGTVRARAGERVIIATFRACRAAGGFDPTSDAAVRLKRLWFGAGPHFCIGAPLAMAQLERIVAALADLAAECDVRIAHRSVQRRRLIPSYRELVLVAS